MQDEEYDLSLMEQIKNDDRSAFTELYQRYKNRLANFFYYLCGNDKYAEDGLQEVFFRVWQYRHKYYPRARVATYLYQIAKNYWLNEAKRLKHKTFSLQTENLQTSEFIDKESPAQQIVNKELRNNIKNAMGQLPEKERLVLVLSEYQGLKYREIAEVLDIAEITVKTRMVRAVRRLREYLGKFRT